MINQERLRQYEEWKQRMLEWKARTPQGDIVDVNWAFSNNPTAFGIDFFGQDRDQVPIYTDGEVDPSKIRLLAEKIRTELNALADWWQTKPEDLP